MPIYQYHCPKCLKDTEIIKSSRDYERAEFCETCSSEMTKAMPKTARPQFRGAGFYETEYKRRGK